MANSNKNTSGKVKAEEVTAIVDDNGRLQAQFVGLGSTEEARDFMNDCGGKVNHLRGATIVCGQRAMEAIQKGRL